MDRKTIEDLKDVGEDDQMWMNLLPAKIKETYTRTFLACISCRYQVNLDSQKDLKKEQKDKVIWEYEIRGDKLMKVLDTKKSIVDCIFAIYSPDVFKEVIDSTKYKELNIGKSLNIKLNEEKIKKAGESKGGASGELFMFSYDNQFILKTATAEEIKVFKSFLPEYKAHVKQYPRTQIGKIFGLFEFTFRESDKSIKLILIGGIVGGKNGVDRKPVHDSAGIRVAEIRLEGQQLLSASDKAEGGPRFRHAPAVRRQDFERPGFPGVGQPHRHRRNPEARVVRERGARHRVFQAVGNHGLLADLGCGRFYVTKVDLKHAPRESEWFTEGFLKNPHVFLSKTNPDRMYFLGIIDYFQKYNFSKSFERFWKRLTNCNCKLDTSSQPPEIYSKRFFKFIEHIIQ